MKILNSLKIAGVALSFAVLTPAAASALPYTSTDSCEVTDMTATATACFGSIFESPINDNNVNFNTDTFGGITGIFSFTDWVFLAKQDMPSSLTGTDIGLNVTESSTVEGSGSWSVNSGALTIFDRVMIILKAGNTFSAYLYNPGTAVGDSGSWLTAALEDKSLSHFSIYTSECVGDNCGGGTGFVVPVPASLPLMLTALGAGGFILRRRQKKAA